MTGPEVLLPLASCAAALLCGAGLLLLRANTKARRVRTRFDTFVMPYALTSAPKFAGRIALASVPLGDLRRRAAILFGIVPDRPDLSARPWVVLPLALLLARLLCGMLAAEFGDVGLLATPLMWVFLCRMYHNWLAARRVATLFRQFPDALAMIVRAVRVGIPVAEAVRGVSQDAQPPTAGEFARLSDQLSVGVALPEALRDLAERNSLPEYRFFATALTLQAQTGGGLSETLEGLADVIRKRVALMARGHALAAEARTSAGILSALPILAGLALAVLNPTYASVLVLEPSGRKVLGLAALMLGAGMLTMRSMIRKSLTP
jgi:tight adherence protein B